MKIFILICLSVFVCKAQYTGYENLDLRKTYRIMDELIYIGHDTNKVIMLLSDTSITPLDSPIRFNNDIEDHLTPYSRKLSEFITQSVFIGGYYFQNAQIIKGGRGLVNSSIIDSSFAISYFIFEFSIMSKVTYNKIWFTFDNHDKGEWKLIDFRLCKNNFPPIENDPCEKNQY